MPFIDMYHWLRSQSVQPKAQDRAARCLESLIHNLEVIGNTTPTFGLDYDKISVCLGIAAAATSRQLDPLRSWSTIYNSLVIKQSLFGPFRDSYHEVNKG